MVFHILESAISILLILGILLQQRAAGLTGSSGGVGTAQVQRRGAEKALYQATQLFAVLFCVLIVLDWYIA